MRTHAVHILLLLALTCFAHAPGVTGSFTSWDDLQTVANNPLLPNLKALWTEPQGHIYIPLTYTLWHLVSLLSPDPLVFKLTSLTVHLSTVILLYHLLRVFLAKAIVERTTTPAFLGALLFAIHPLQVESVAWISGLKDLLAGLFAVATLLALTKNRLPLALLFFTLALLSKPAAVWLLPAAAAYCLLYNRPALKYLPLALIPALATTLYARHIQPPVADLAPISLNTRILVPFDALFWYLTKLLLPFRLAIDPGRSPQWLATYPFASLTALAGAILSLALIWFAGSIAGRLPNFDTERRHRQALTVLGLLVALIALLPNLGLLPFDFQTYSTVSDHYAYPAFIGISIAAAAFFSRIPVPTKFPAGITCLFLLGLLALCFNQSKTWHSSETLFTHATQINPNSLPAHNNIASLLLDQSHPDKAAPHITRAQQILAAHHYPRSLRALVLYNQARLQSAQGMPEHAILTLAQAIAIDPALPEAHFELARLHQQQNNATEAEREYQKVADLNPAYPGLNANLSALALSQGHYPQAEHYARAELTLTPTNPTAAGNLAAALLAQNKQDEAAQVATNHPTSPAAQNVLGILAARSGNLDKAESHLRQATQKDPNSAPYLYNLANILSAQNKTEEAQPLYQKALTLGYEPARAKIQN